MKYLITYTLLNSWLYWLNFDGDDDKQAKKDFENTLNKIWIDNEFMQAGRVFEYAIEGIIKNWGIRPLDCDKMDCALEIADIVWDGVWAVTGNKTIEISGQEFVLHGKTDVLRGPDIFDIKFVKRYKCSKYFSSTQHKMYFEVLPHTERFTYLVSDGKEVYQETYNRDETNSIIPVIADFLSWINQFPDYLKAYQEKWEA